MQAFDTHSAPAAHVSAAPEAHVAVIALHEPDAHTASASAQVPPCSPSFGIGAPAASSATQVIVVRLQNEPSPQSPSIQHPACAGTQWPLVQVLVVHSEAELQFVDAAVAQVFSAALHTPERQTADALNEPQVPSCRPSFGMGEPAVRSGAQDQVERSQ